VALTPVAATSSGSERGDLSAAAAIDHNGHALGQPVQRRPVPDAGFRRIQADQPRPYRVGKRPRAAVSVAGLR
jgi:hypothetical protein